MAQSNLKRVMSILFALALFFFILTASIALPIYIRPFYYAHIDTMGLPESSGFTREQIISGYNQVLDYLTIPGKEFGTGIMAYSESGAAHFADCKVLFSLNAGILLSSSVCLLILLLLRRTFGPYRLGKRSSAFYGASAAIVIPLVVGFLASLNFDRAFVIFHSIFFPGKDNWIFDYRTDQIIRVLPQAFFMHCAMLIGAGVLVIAGSVLICDRIRSKRKLSV